MFHFSKSGKTRISAPAHLSATGGRVSGLVSFLFCKVLVFAQILSIRFCVHSFCHYLSCQEHLNLDLLYRITRSLRLSVDVCYPMIHPRISKSGFVRSSVASTFCNALDKKVNIKWPTSRMVKECVKKRSFCSELSPCSHFLCRKKVKMIKIAKKKGSKKG